MPELVLNSFLVYLLGTCFHNSTRTMVPDIRTSGPSGPAGADSPRALSVSGPAGGTISICLVLAYPVRWLSGVYCETGHPVSGPSGYQYPTDWYPIRSGPGTEIDFGVIRPDAPDYLTGPVTTPVEPSVGPQFSVRVTCPWYAVS